MEKRIKRIQVDFDFLWKDGGDIKMIKRDLDLLEKMGADEIKIRIEDDYGQNYILIDAFKSRLETDDEYNSRIEDGKRKEEALRLKELKLLEELKAKYEKER